MIWNTDKLNVQWSDRLIFGAGAVEAVAVGTGPGGHLSLMGACLMIALVVSPWAASAAVRIAIE